MPGELQLRSSTPDYAGRLVVIGTNIDEKALKAYRKAHPSGGTVPLMRAYSSYWKTITVSDEVLASLNAGLPDGCEIVVSPNKPLSVKIKSSLGMRIILR